jgi:hypothetical protein
MNRGLLGWEVVADGQEKHILPLNDSGEHVMQMKCRCHPFRHADDSSIVVHDAFDGRLKFETGERKVS